MYRHVHVYMYIYIYTHHVYLYIHIFIYRYIYTNVHANMYIQQRLNLDQLYTRLKSQCNSATHSCIPSLKSEQTTHVT